MRVVIPSLGRAGTCASMKWVPSTGRSIAFMVHSDEVEAYRRAYPQGYVSVYGLPEETRHHTGLVRKWIMEQIREPFIFVDDDIRVTLKTVPNVGSALDVIERHVLQGASMAGLAPQLFSNFANTTQIGSDFLAVRNKFVATVYAINPKDFDACPLEQLPVYEDVALVIHAIKYGTGTVCTYCATHSNVSPPLGGCNSWRNEVITLQCLQKIVELYPDVCSIKETNNTTHSQNIGVGLRVAWSKIKKVS